GRVTARQVTRAAQPRQRLGQRGLKVVGVDVVDDHVPLVSVELLPGGVLLLEPLALFLADARLGAPPERGPPVPKPHVQAVVPGIEASHELVPEPRLAQPVLLDRPDELIDDPLLHELAVRLLAMLER